VPTVAGIRDGAVQQPQEFAGCRSVMPQAEGYPASARRTTCCPRLEVVGPPRGPRPTSGRESPAGRPCPHTSRRLRPSDGMRGPRSPAGSSRRGDVGGRPPARIFSTTTPKSEAREADDYQALAVGGSIEHCIWLIALIRPPASAAVATEGRAEVLVTRLKGPGNASARDLLIEEVRAPWIRAKRLRSCVAAADPARGFGRRTGFSSAVCEAPNLGRPSWAEPRTKAWPASSWRKIGPHRPRQPAAPAYPPLPTSGMLAAAIAFPGGEVGWGRISTSSAVANRPGPQGGG